MNHGAFEVEELAVPAARTARGSTAPALPRPAGLGLRIPGQEWRATGLEASVFADPSGRRARTMRGVGLALVSVTLAALAIVVTAVVGFGRLPAPGMPALAAVPVHHPGHAVLVAGVRAEARERIVLPASPAPRDVDRRAHVRD